MPPQKSQNKSKKNKKTFTYVAPTEEEIKSMQTAACGKATHNSTSTWINALGTFPEVISIPADNAVIQDYELYFSKRPPICEDAFYLQPCNNNEVEFTATLPWLNPSNTTNEDPLQDTNNDFLNFVNNHTQNKVDKVDKTNDIIKVSDDDTSKEKELSPKKTGRKKNNRKTNGCTTDVDKPSKRTRRKISDLATEFLQDKSDID
ncbi:unnamed protein product [Rhizophagus irregularis]|nr:unnamed protein product [Rhizophagus irregularis]